MPEEMLVELLSKVFMAAGGGTGGTILVGLVVYAVYKWRKNGKEPKRDFCNTHALMVKDNSIMAVRIKDIEKYQEKTNGVLFEKMETLGENQHKFELKLVGLKNDFGIAGEHMRLIVGKFDELKDSVKEIRDYQINGGKN